MRRREKPPLPKFWRRQYQVQIKKHASWKRPNKLVYHTALRLDLICAKTFLSQKAINHWIGKSLDVSRCFEDSRMSQDRAIHTDDIVALVHHHTPPIVFQIALQFDAERTVIPAAVQAAVDFARLENETAPFA